MSLANDVKEAAVAELGKLLVRLPIEGIKLLIDLAANALRSDDPTRYIQRRAAAQASELAAETLIETTLAASEAAAKPKS